MLVRTFTKIILQITLVLSVLANIGEDFILFTKLFRWLALILISNTISYRRLLLDYQVLLGGNYFYNHRGVWDPCIFRDEKSHSVGKSHVAGEPCLIHLL